MTVNHCWFKNEENKRPQEFDYSVFKKIGKALMGLYHPHCHCKKSGLNVPKPKDINLIIVDGKINNFFNRKSNWYYSWGYRDSDKDSFIKQLKEQTIQEYIKGNYEIEKHDKYGFHINIFVEIKGINLKKNRVYRVKTCYIVYPNGALRNTTIVGGDYERV